MDPQDTVSSEKTYLRFQGIYTYPYVNEMQYLVSLEETIEREVEILKANESLISPFHFLFKRRFDLCEQLLNDISLKHINCSNPIFSFPFNFCKLTKENHNDLFQGKIPLDQSAFFNFLIST